VEFNCPSEGASLCLMNGPKVKLTDSIHGEPPLACSGKEKEEIHPTK